MDNQNDLLIDNWGLPSGVLEFYKKRGISRMLPWQLECLTKGSVLNGGNVIYSAPTSAGKTLVAEILVSQCVFERKKKALIILPFVSVVREKMFYFQEMFGENGARVEGFMGGHSPSASFHQVQVAVCTIEKANSIINKMLEESNLDLLGAVVVDELHLLGDPYRGYLLELLLTKLKFVSSINPDIDIQIIGMSATLPNLHMLAKWLDANLYFTDFRPVPLIERMKSGKSLLNDDMIVVREITPDKEESGDDSEHVGFLCMETIKTGHAVLIFCPTKVWCENLALKLASYFRKLGCSQNALNEGTAGWFLRQQLNLPKLKTVIDHLKMCPVGLDKDLEKTVSFGVAFHHAGLTLDERDVIEGSFRNGSIKVLCATSTLSSGVNLPARRVIIRSPMSFGGVMDVMTYRQMIGRAGRMGVDTEGESVLICKRGEERIGAQLMRAGLRPIQSCLGSSRLSASLKRAVLEAIGGGLASTAQQVAAFAESTFLAFCSPRDVHEPLSTCLSFLEDTQLIRRKGDEEGTFTVTPLGEACLASSLPPDEGLALFMELDRARRCFVLDSDLHIIYQITPFSVSEQWTKIDWLRMLNMLEQFSPSMRRVAELVGVEDAFLVKVVKGNINLDTLENRTKLSIHRRFYTALALQDLVTEVPLTTVAHNFDCNKGMLQSLQQSAATYAGMVAEFARRLRWSTIQLIVSEFQERLQFGVQRELCELMRLPSLSAVRARALFNSGITTLSQVASAEIDSLENAFLKAIPFHSRDNDNVRHVWITGRAGISICEAAQILRKEARDALELELGVQANWHTAPSFETALKMSQSVSQSSKNRRFKVPKTSLSINENEKLKKTVVKTKTDFLKPDSQLEKIPTRVKKNSQIVSDILSSKAEKKLPQDCVMKPPPVNLSTLKALLDSSDWNTPVKSQSSDYEKSTVLLPEEEEPTIIRQSRLSNDLFECLTPVNNKSRPVVDSPDIFNQSLTFDTQLERICDSEHVTDLPPSPIKSDDLGYLSNSSSLLITDNSTDNVLLETVGESFFFKDKRKRKPSVGDISVSESNATKRSKSQHLVDDNDQEIAATPANFLAKNWETLNIIDISKNDQVFELFYRDLEKEQVIGLSVACRQKKSEPVKKIGSTIGGNVRKDKKVEEMFFYNNFIIDGFAVYWQTNVVFYLPCHNEGLAKNKICDFINKLSDSGKTIRMYDSREQLRLLGFLGLHLNCVFQDAKVAEWLFDSSKPEASLQDLVKKHLPWAECFADLLGVSNTVTSPAFDIQSDISPRNRACYEAFLTFHLVQEQLNQLETINLAKVFENVEMPIIRILAEMEVSGLKFHQTKLSFIKNELEKLIGNLEQNAYSIVGRKFALASHKAIAKILYTEIRLGKDSKKKQTNKETLELLEIETNHPLPGVILKWRKLKAILTKTLGPLLRLLPSTRIHGSCKTFTVSGRISMAEPNLQNVAKDFQIQSTRIRLRELFVPEQGFVFLSADYCQIELRLLAELSDDQKLIKDIKESSDVFNSIAASVFSLKLSEVTQEHRQRAKQTCYGIIYGIGARSLAQQLRISVPDAQMLMNDFNLKYQRVRAFVNNSISDCRNVGYISTLSGRRRYLPGINSLDAAARGEAERQAVNTRIQGSAADLVKVAMTQIAKHSKAQLKNELKLVLQLHDEVMYEVRRDLISQSALIIKNNMESASGLCGLEMPFPVKVKIGPSWGDLVTLSL